MDGNIVYGSTRIGYGSGNTVTGARIRNNYFVNPGKTAIQLISCTPDEFTGNVIVGNVLGLDPADYPGNTYLSNVPDAVIVRANEYETDRANVAVLNGSEAESVTVDLSVVTGLSAGDSVSVRNVQDYFTDIQTLTLTAGETVTVDMRAASHTVASPVNHAAPATTFPVYGAFVIEKA